MNVFSKHQTFGIVSGGAAGLTAARHSLSGALSYIWQFYLPRLLGMHNDFNGIFTTRQIWFRNVIGLYGWGDTAFPNWVYDVALIPMGAIAALCIRAFALRSTLRGRVAELATYATMSLGLLGLIGASGYLASPKAPRNSPTRAICCGWSSCGRRSLPLRRAARGVAGGRSWAFCSSCW